jgi:hypothetical protein
MLVCPKEFTFFLPELKRGFQDLYVLILDKLRLAFKATDVRLPETFFIPATDVLEPDFYGVFGLRMLPNKLAHLEDVFQILFVPRFKGQTLRGVLEVLEGIILEVGFFLRVAIEGAVRGVEKLIDFVDVIQLDAPGFAIAADL